MYALKDEFSLVFAGDRAQALARLREGQPALVSLDLGLPPAPDTAEEGLRALEEILRAAPTTRVVVLTGNADRANALRAVQALTASAQRDSRQRWKARAWSSEKPSHVGSSTA